jgi:hypothetical protein
MPGAGRCHVLKAQEHAYRAAPSRPSFHHAGFVHGVVAGGDDAAYPVIGPEQQSHAGRRRRCTIMLFIATCA